MNQVLFNTFVTRLRSNQLMPEEQLERAIALVGEDDLELAEYLVQDGSLTRFQARQLRAGSTSLSVGNYVVCDFIGRGGTGIVLKAYHRLMPARYVALKTIETRNLHASGEVAARFRREIDIVSKLDHPNVIRALDVIQTRSHLYLVLEFVSGPDLGKLVKARGPLPVTEAVDYAIQAARGLGYSHRLGIVHRDLKPTNLLMADDRVVKISDLGLARFFASEPDSGLTMKGLAIGTPEYMAPEQAEDARAVDPRSDLFSLGATLFHLLTGVPGVDGSSYIHKLQKLLTGIPRPLAEVRGDLPTGLAQAVDRFRSRRPEDRPQTAEEAIALLEPFGSKPEPVSASPPSPLQIAELVLAVLRGQKNSAVLCREYGWTGTEFETHQQRFIEGGFRAFDPAQDHPELEDQLKNLHAKIGVQQMEIEALKRQLKSR